MPALASSQAAPTYLEKLRPAAGILFERDNTLFSKFEKNSGVEKVSPRSMRLDLKIRPGGKAGVYNPDGGNLGRGSGTTRVEALVSPIFFKFACEVNKLVEYATNSAEKAVENVAKDEFKNGIAQFRSFLEKLLQGAGDGVMATIASGAPLTGASAVWTVDKPYAFYFNQDVQVYLANLSSSRGTATITQIDVDAGTITVDVGPAGTIATDVLLPAGLSGANPVSLYGLKYHHSNASTGTWLNLNRATYPEIRTPRVNAGNSSLVTGHVRLALNKIRKALGVDAMEGQKAVAYMNVEQEHAWEQLGITISEIIREGSQDMPDLLFNKKGSMGGVPMLTSINADPLRIDFIVLKNWIRAVIKDIDLYEEGGETVFPVTATSGADAGGLVAAKLFYWDYGVQIANQNPRMGSFIDALTKPTGY